MKKATVILNPRAGKGRGARIVPRLKEGLIHHGFEIEFVSTERPGQASELARSARSELVVAVGGDGTINEVVNGIVGLDKVLGIIPCGSGNDLIKTLGISAVMEHAIEQLATRSPKSIDLGTVACSNGRHPEISAKRLFVNGVGIGFDAAVAEKTLTFKHLSGTVLYLASVFLTLGEYRAPTFKTRMEGLELEGKCLLIAVGNGRCAGGGFYLTPGAQIDDGKLDVCIVGDLSIMGILKLMPRVMQGAHSNRKEVTMARTRSLSIEADRGFFVHADGEIICKGSTALEIGIRPNSIQVIH